MIMIIRVKTSKIEMEFEQAASEPYCVLANNYKRADKYGSSVRKMALEGVREVVKIVTDAHKELEK